MALQGQMEQSKTGRTTSTRPDTPTVDPPRAASPPEHREKHELCPRRQERLSPRAACSDRRRVWYSTISCYGIGSIHEPTWYNYGYAAKNGDSEDSDFSIACFCCGIIGPRRSSSNRPMNHLTGSGCLPAPMANLHVPIPNQFRFTYCKGWQEMPG